MDDRGGAAGPAPDGPTAPTWTVELVVAGLLALAGGVVMADSLRVGTGWGAEGPQAGFFPFYVGLILFASAATTFALGLAPALRPRENFVGRRELGRVMGLLVPAAVFVAAANWLGIAISLVLFVAFELWLLMPLPKGPLEAALGF
jgi:putative tricarboxylic transport membrane protein